jgi:iron complex outermembrane receptor protein
MFDNRTTNIAIQKVRGVDFGVDGRMRSAVGEISFGLNATFNQQLEKWMTPTSPAILMQNEVGKPVDLRLRANVGWTHSAWGAYLHLNYVDNYKNPVRSPATKISSWTTADLTVRFQGDGSGVEWLSGVDVSLSARNIFDRDPPRFGDNTRGLLYDPANANALGRYVTLG